MRCAARSSAAHRLERPGADVQRDESDLDAARARVARSSASSKCRPAVGAATAPGRARVDGLVALRRPRPPAACVMYGGSGTVAVALEHARARSLLRSRRRIELAVAPDRPSATTASASRSRAPWLRRVARPDLRERFVVVPEHALDEHLDLAARVLDAVQPRLDDAGVVEHQHVAGATGTAAGRRRRDRDSAVRREAQQAARGALAAPDAAR